MASLRKYVFGLVVRWLGDERAFGIVASARLTALQTAIESRVGEVVQQGPFAGMRLPRKSSWGTRERHLKLLGFYEQELHAIVDRIVSRGPDLVINVGCAEGYYAVGMALRLPRASVVAFDVDVRSAEVCMEAARVNGVENRVKVGRRFSREDMDRLLASGGRTAVIMDCEGCEADALLNSARGLWRNCDFLVECHDFLVEGVTDRLSQALSETHVVQRVAQGARNPHSIEKLVDCSELERWLLMDENRPEAMTWIYATPICDVSSDHSS